jgi:uncharacterized protein
MATAQNLIAFRNCVGDLLTTEEVESMVQWRRHCSVSCLDHSLFVAYLAFRGARFLGLDYAAAARGGLLHDLFLYDPKDKNAHPGNQCLDHPRYALRNARRLCPDLTPKEENNIISHMWPLAPSAPRSGEALLVGIADKTSALLELSHLCRLGAINRRLPSGKTLHLA